MKTSTKIIIWSTVAAVMIGGGYLIYRQYKKNKEAAAKSEKRSAIIKEIGSFVSGLFGKKTTESSKTKTVQDYSKVSPYEVFPYGETLYG